MRQFLGFGVGGSPDNFLDGWDSGGSHAQFVKPQPKPQPCLGRVAAPLTAYPHPFAVRVRGIDRYLYKAQHAGLHGAV